MWMSKYFLHKRGSIMKYSNSRYIGSPDELDGILYFAHRLEEMLFDYSIDLYKMPLLNTHGLAREYGNVVKKVASGEIKEYQRNIVFDEFLASFNNDIVLKENWGSNKIEYITKSFGSNSQTNKDNTIAYIDSTLSNGRYYNWIIKTLLKYTKLPKEKKKIEATLRCFVPELISMGYDAEFIYTTLNKHFFKGAILSNTSVEEFISVFDLNVHTYSVYFSVSQMVKHFRDILEKRMKLHFDDDGNFSSFHKDSNKIIVYFNNIKARCPNSAARIAYNRLDMFFRFYKFVGDKKGLSIQKRAMVKEKDFPPAFVTAKKLSYNIIDNIDYAEIGSLSDELIIGLLINAEDEYSVLSKAIELHNTAISVPDLKSGFLNFWSAVEILCQGHTADSKIGPVLDVVLPILKKDYLVTQIQDFTQNLKDNLSKQDYDYIISQIHGPGCEKQKIFQLIFLNQYDPLRKELLAKLADYPVLRSRLCLLSSMNTTKKLNTMICSYVQRVKWHIYRMYRTRNSIVHSGEVPRNLKYLGEHLHSYLDSTANEFIAKLAGDIPFSSREDVITDVKFAISNLDSILEKDISVDEKVIDTLIHPEIGYVLNCKTHSKDR